MCQVQSMCYTYIISLTFTTFIGNKYSHLLLKLKSMVKIEAREVDRDLILKSLVDIVT